ncbi:MAG: hypothetical protein IPN29_06875 [Saprospiraceae bacterium]|nr:hypothetical protein [Saprospiraceae bacterium]
MKAVFILFICLFYHLCCFGQSFSKIEYFFDVDPGIGNGTALPITIPGDTVSFNASIPTTMLTSGFHFLGMRIMHINGKWSLYERRNFYILEAPAANVADISAAEYFFDADPGVGNGVQITISPAGQTVNASVSIPLSLPAGFHNLSLRTRDLNGRWSMYERRNFYILEAPAANVADISAAEYFFDADPGVGNGVQIPISPAGQTVNASVSIPLSLPAGFHNLSLRTRDLSGRWSLYERRNFLYFANGRKFC